MRNIEFEYKKLNLSELHITSNWSLHPFSQHTPDILQKSLQTSGVLHPPIVKKQHNKYELICGKKRVEFLLKCNIPSVNTQILPKNTTIAEQLQIILSDQLTSAPLTIVERAFFIKLASKHLTKSEILSHFSNQLPCKKHQATIQEHLDLLETDTNILGMIHNNILSEQSAKSLLTMSAKDQTSISQLINQLRPGAGKQKRIITMLQDLSHRKHCTIATYIEQQHIQEILQHEGMNSPQKAQHLIDILQRKHTPSLHQAQIDFKNESLALNLPSYVELLPSHSFEKNNVFLTIKFNNLAEVKRKWSEIEKVISEN